MTGAVRKTADANQSSTCRGQGAHGVRPGNRLAGQCLCQRDALQFQLAILLLDCCNEGIGRGDVLRHGIRQ